MTADANLATFLLDRAAASPDAVALRAMEGSRERIVTFAQLADLSARAAALLHARGLRPGDRVLIFQPVSVDLYVALLAIFRLGLTAMFADPSTGLAHLARCCELARPRAFIGPPRAHALRLLSPTLRRIEVPLITTGWLPFTTRWQSSKTLPPHYAIAPAAADTPALLTFTSGSTGQPKAVVRTHGFLRAQHRTLADTLTLTAGETDLATLPIFVLANLASGVTTVLPAVDLRRPGHFKTGPVARQIHRLRPTRTAASPAFLERLLEEKIPLTGFRKIYTGGAPVFPDLLHRLRAATGPAAEIVAVYGSTEAEPMAHLSARDVTPADLTAMRSGCGLLAGTPVPSVRLRIIPDRWGTPLGTLSDADFTASLCPPGTAGEIVVTGDHAVKGYLHGTGNHETKFRVADEIWHRTGDAGFLDASGRLWLLGRCTARITDAHGTQYALPVECAARLLTPSIRRCAFLALDDQRTLLIETKHPLPSTDLSNLKAALAWSGLENILRLPRIPVDLRHNAKIDYVALHRQLASRHVV